MLTYVFSCNQCDSLAPIWQELAIKINIKDNVWKYMVSQKVNPQVVIAKADCSAEDDLCMGKSP